MKRVFPVALLVLLVSSTLCWGRPKNDIVTLHNGDRITCAIKSLYAGMLEFGSWRFDPPELDLRFTINLYPSLTDTGRLRGDSDLRLRWEL